LLFVSANDFLIVDFKQNVDKNRFHQMLERNVSLVANYADT
jgi:RIO-like serine/threonine protein kinase